jgi:hypothetical protein
MSSILYYDRYNDLLQQYINPYMTRPFQVSAQEYNQSAITATGRHLKDDKNRASVAQEYLSDYYLVNQLMVERHIALGLPLNPVPPDGITNLGWAQQQSGPRGRGGGGGGGSKGSGTGTFQDCGRPSINWYNGKIIDTGNPQANYFPTAPGSFNQMGPIYARNNVTIVNGVTSVVPAQNGIATGRPQSATQCNSQWRGFDTGGFYGSRYLLHC